MRACGRSGGTRRGASFPSADRLDGFVACLVDCRADVQRRRLLGRAIRRRRSTTTRRSPTGCAGTSATRSTVRRSSRAPAGRRCAGTAGGEGVPATRAGGLARSIRRSGPLHGWPRRRWNGAVACWTGTANARTDTRARRQRAVRQTRGQERPAAHRVGAAGPARHRRGPGAAPRRPPVPAVVAPARSRRSRSTAGTTGPSGSARSSRSGCRAATGTPSRSRRSSGGCRCSPRRSRCRSRPRWRRARPTPASRTRGRSTAGSTATSRRRADRRPARLRERPRRLPARARPRRRDGRAGARRAQLPPRRPADAPTTRRPTRRSPRSATRSRRRGRAGVGRRDAHAWDRDPVWFHGDVAVGNLLVRDGRLAAVLDFGSSGVGDPACDLVIAWTLPLRPSRARFRADARRRPRHVVARPRVGAVEGAHHARRLSRTRRAEAALPRRDIREVLADYDKDR